MKVSEQYWDDLTDYRDSLEHYGVKGMKWGVRKKYETAGGRKKRTFSEAVKDRRVQRAKNRVARAKARAEKQALTQKQKAEKAAALKAKKRQDILNNPTQLYKHRREYSAEEIQAAMRQFEWEKKLSEYSKAQLNNGAEFIKTMVAYTSNAIALYNNAARVANSFSSDLNIPVIQAPKNDGKKDDKNKSK